MLAFYRGVVPVVPAVPLPVPAPPDVVPAPRVVPDVSPPVLPAPAPDVAPGVELVELVVMLDAPSGPFLPGAVPVPVDGLLSRELLLPELELVPAPVSLPVPLVPVSRLQAVKRAEQAINASNFFIVFR